MNIAVLDAQGAGIGKTIIKEIRDAFGKSVMIYALGTNQTATANMMNAGADIGSTGEQEILKLVSQNLFDCIIGPIGIIASGGILGEITPAISKSIFSISCKKYIIALHFHQLFIPGATDLKISQSIDMIIADIKRSL